MSRAQRMLYCECILQVYVDRGQCSWTECGFW